MEFLLPAVLGGLSGARTASGPALVAWQGRHGGGWSSGLAAASAAMACGEMLADESSWIPDRVAPALLVGRAAAGALAGATVAVRGGGRPVRSALVGAASAVASAWATFVLRRAASRRLGWKAGALEDALVYGLGAIAVARLQPAS